MEFETLNSPAHGIVTKTKQCTKLCQGLMGVWVGGHGCFYMSFDILVAKALHCEEQNLQLTTWLDLGIVTFSIAVWHFLNK